MPGMSPAARGQKRGALEVLKYPPSFTTNLMSGFYLDAVNTYSFIGVILSCVGVFFFGPFLFFFVFLMLLAFSFSFIDEDKKKVVNGLKNAANETVETGEPVKVSEYVNSSVHYSWEQHYYIDNLNSKQQKWIADRWEKEIDFAIQKTVSPRSTFAGQLNSSFSAKEAKEIEYHKKALEELSKSKDVNSLEGFDKKFKEFSESEKNNDVNSMEGNKFSRAREWFSRFS